MRLVMLGLVALLTLGSLAGCGSDDCKDTATCPVSTGGGGEGAGGGDGVGGNGGAPSGGGGAGGEITPAVVTALALGFEHSCALFDDGSVVCWGSNSDGQLGNGSFQASSQPVAADISDVRAIATGGDSTCAVKNDDTAWCWGDNANGQLGTNNTSDSIVPVQVSGLSGVSGIDVSREHACAVLADGSARCWGSNSSGQLGNGSTNPSLVPTAVSGLTTATTISVGAASYGPSSCALLSDGTAMCWGDNQWGQLTQMTADALVPKLVVTSTSSTLDDLTEIAAGGAYTCALLGDGTSRCWGVNYGGELGPATGPNEVYPMPVMGAQDGALMVTSATEDSGHTCTVETGGAIYCWGAFGISTYIQGFVPALGPADRVGTGDKHDCALLQDNTVWCWGNNAAGQLGDGTTTASPDPVQVLLP